MLNYISKDDSSGAAKLIKIDDHVESLKLVREDPEVLSSNYLLARKLVISTKSGFDFVNLSQIESCTADGNYTIVHLATNGKLVISKTLKAVSEQLDYRFFRIHKGTIVNLSYLRSVHSGKSRVVLESGREYPISRLNKKLFLELFNSKLKQ